MTETRTDPTMGRNATDPAVTDAAPVRTTGVDQAGVEQAGVEQSGAGAAPQTAANATGAGPAGGRTADDIVADRDAGGDAGRGASAPLSTADIASGRGTGNGAANAASTAAADRTAGRDVGGERVAPLFDEAATTDLRDRWTDVQAGFVDEPRSAVERADGLVAEVMQRLADSFATERTALEQQWSRGDDVSTEDLRVALRRYRSFFDRLLSF